VCWCVIGLTNIVAVVLEVKKVKVKLGYIIVRSEA